MVSTSTKANARWQSGESTEQKNGTSNPTPIPKKWQRVLSALLDGRTFNRFEAERQLNDHALHSTVSTLQAKGVTVLRKFEVVPGYQGIATHVCRYWLEQSEPKLLVAFSGGKESILLADLLKQHKEAIELVWCNTQAMFPHMIEFVRAYRDKGYALVELESDQPARLLREGLPSSVVPIDFMFSNLLLFV